MSVNSKSILTVSASPDFKKLLKECSEVYKMNVSQFLRVCVFTYIDIQTHGGVYGDKGLKAYEEYKKC